jgi:hypothetical protein
MGADLKGDQGWSQVAATSEENGIMTPNTQRSKQEYMTNQEIK